MDNLLSLTASNFRAAREPMVATSQSRRRKKRKALKEEQALSEEQLHREGTLRKVRCYILVLYIHNTTDVLSAFCLHFWYVAIAVAEVIPFMCPIQIYTIVFLCALCRVKVHYYYSRSVN